MPSVKCPKCNHLNSSQLERCARCGVTLPKVQLHAQQPSGPKRNPTTFKRGQNVARRYTVMEMIGKGGMGCIYLVQDNVLREHVALKTLLPQFARDKMIVERFHNEAKIARQLSHPNIVRVHDIGLDENIIYISMEFVKGRSLRAILDGLVYGDRLPIKTTLRIFDQLCAALEYAHQFTVHRDIKPENVMVLQDGSVKLMDFGISKLMAETRMTSGSVVMGTPHYMSPEQLKDSRNVDCRADIYSLGVMLYEILTGNLPTGVPRPASQVTREVPPALDPIVARCLDPDPAQRFPSATELRKAIRPVLEMAEYESQTAFASPSAHGPGRARRLSPRTALGWGGIAVTALLVALGLWAAEGHRAHVIEAAAAPAAPVESPEELALRRLDQLIQEMKASGVKAKNLAREKEGLRVVTDEADLLAQDADDAREVGDIGLATELAAQAWESYLTVNECPEGMLLVPAGTPGPDGAELSTGFYVDAAPVTMRQYRAFQDSLEEGWGLPTNCAEQDLDTPVVGITLYDAVAYASWSAKRVPTRGEWEFAAHAYPEALKFRQSMFERTCTTADGEEGIDAVDFGEDTFVLRASIAPPAEEGAPPTVGIEPQLLPYEASNALTGFRCVSELPKVERPEGAAP